jgi:hypothetical protein
MVNIFIYTLTNLTNNKVFYIGRAVNMKQRLNIHLNDRNSFKSKKNDILAEILSAGLSPLIEEIDCVTCKSSKDETYANSVEEYWISQFRAWGFTLVNVSGIKRKYKESLKITWERHDKEYSLLEENKYLLGRKLRAAEAKSMPPQMDTPLGRRCWAFDIKKERESISYELEVVTKKIKEKEKQYYNHR